MTKKSSYQEISQEQVIEISSEYFDDRKAWISSQEIPTAVLVAGQPGAGKSRLAKTVRSFLKNQGGYIHIDADRMREELPTNGVAYPSAVTQKDAGRLVAALRKQVVSDHINFLEEGTFRDAQNVAAFTDALKNQGYRVELRVVSASPEESLLGIYERYESQISAGSENPRILEESYHQVAFEGFCNTVKERERFFDRVQVVNRQNEILYDSQHPLPGQTAYSALLEGHVLDTDRLNKLKAGWNNVYEIALNRKEPDSDYLLKISNNRSRVADLTIAGTDISTNNTANIQMVREESSLPDSMLYR
ncbi:zeta toxin family protein, partial [Neisseria elongata]